MPIAIRGTLRVKSVQGRAGTFSVGDLKTDIGKFRIKDPTLDQFQAGVYTGQFWISEIFHSSYVTDNGHMIIELRARTVAMQIDDEDTRNPPSAGLPEPDPLDEERVAATPVPAEAKPKTKLKRIIRPISQKTSNTPSSELPTTLGESSSDTASQPVPAAPESDPSSVAPEDLELFGAEITTLVTAREPVKLDPTVDRVVLRQQAARLIQLGYAFKSQLQTWLHNT